MCVCVCVCVCVSRNMNFALNTTIITLVEISLEYVEDCSNGIKKSRGK